MFTGLPLSSWWSCLYTASSTLTSTKELSSYSAGSRGICIEICSPLPATCSAYRSLTDHSSHCHVCVCGNCLFENAVKTPLRKFYKMILPSCCMSYLLLPNLSPSSPDSYSFNVTSQGCVRGHGPQWRKYRWSLALLSVFLCDLSH